MPASLKKMFLLLNTNKNTSYVYDSTKCKVMQKSTQTLFYQISLQASQNTLAIV